MSFEELNDGLLRLNCRLTTGELEEILQEFDDDGDGDISLAEWSSFVYEHCVQHEQVNSVRAEALKKWDSHEQLLENAADDNKLQALRQVCMQLQHGLHATYQHWDVDGDGILSVKEVRTGITTVDGNLLEVDEQVLTMLIDIVMDGSEEIKQDAFAVGMYALENKLDMSMKTQKAIVAKPHREDPIDYVHDVSVAHNTARPTRLFILRARCCDPCADGANRQDQSLGHAVLRGRGPSHGSAGEDQARVSPGLCCRVLRVVMIMMFDSFAQQQNPLSLSHVRQEEHNTCTADSPRDPSAPGLSFAAAGAAP